MGNKTIKNIKVEENITKFKRGEVIETILKSLAVVTIVGGTIVIPSLPIVLGIIIGLVKEDKTNIPNYKIKRALNVLEKRKIIKLIQKKDSVYVEFLENGRTDILKYSIKQILDFKKEKKEWRRKWILVVFDVPEEENIKRRHMRRLLKYLGFYQYQKSVYVFPYECFEEIKLIKEITSSGKYLKYIVADQLEDEKRIKIFFGMT